jgi:iron(III) transport system substrate-binding protein
VAQDKVLNLYSARHYQTDEKLYENFTRQTGIKINRIDGKEDELMERIRNEGANSPADVFITVDAARLATADALGLFAPVKSKLLEARIPAHLHTDTWFAFSTRARVIIYNRSALKAEDVANLRIAGRSEAQGQGVQPLRRPSLQPVAGRLADRPRWRSEDRGMGQGRRRQLRPRAEGRRYRPDQVGGAGECGVAVSNTYYLARLIRSDKVEDRRMMEKVGIVWPNQANRGTHINISGAGMVKTAKKQSAAVKPSSNTWPATTRSAISPMATTNGRRCLASPPITRHSTRWASSRPTPCRSAPWRRTSLQRKSCLIGPVTVKRRATGTQAARSLNTVIPARAHYCPGYFQMKR